MSGAAPVLALVVAIILASVVVHQVTPASLLPRPDRPFGGFGNPEMRVENGSYPRHAIGTDDVRTTIEAPPRRLVSQSSSIDEYLYSIVSPELVVGVSDVAYQERISNVVELAKRHRPVVALDPEQVVRTDPDLVLTPAETRFDVPGLLRASGLSVHRTQTMVATLAGVESQIRLIGYLTGEDGRADAEVARFREAVRRAAARKPANAPRPRVLGFGGVYSYGSETLFSDILRVLGAENVAETHGFIGYDRVTDEHIVRWNPEWIVAGADRGLVNLVRTRLLAHPAIASTTAARLGHLVVLENHVFLPLSPFTAHLVEALADVLYGGTS